MYTYHILILATKLDQRDPAIALNYAIFLYNRSCQDKNTEENVEKVYEEAIDKIKLFEMRVIHLREGSSGVATGMDADPDVLIAAAALANEMEYKLSISTPDVPESAAKFVQQQKPGMRHDQDLLGKSRSSSIMSPSLGSAAGTSSKRLTSSAAVKSARASYKRQMKIEQAAAAEALESSNTLDEPTGNHEETHIAEEPDELS